MHRLLALSLLAGCFSVDLGNGGQYRCASSGQVCPTGYSCFQGDQHCYKNGYTPGGGSEDLAVEPDDLSASSDLAGVVADLTALDLYGVTVFNASGATTVYELDAVAVTMTATTHSGSAVALDATNLPSGATFTAGTLSWTPTYKQAGVYSITINATAADPSENGSYILVLTVKNLLDPVIRPDGTNPSSVYGVTSIPDFDKDGFGDVAICAGDQGTNTYTIRILYGDASGLPLGTPYPAARTKLYTFSSGSPLVGTTTPTCISGDYDGDGYGDVVLADGFAYGGATNSGRIFVAFGVPRITDTLPTIELIAPAPTVNMFMGAFYLTSGDFDGDGKSDVATMPVSGAMSNGTDDRHFIWKGGARSNNSSPVVYSPPSGACTNSAGGTSNFGDVDQDGKQELLVWDHNVGLAACGGDGEGLRILTGTTGPSPSPQNFRHPTAHTGSSGYFGMNNSVLCDVDHDGKSDLVFLDSVGMYVFYGSASGITATNPLDVTGLNAVTTPQGNNCVRCVKDFFGTASVVHGRTGSVEIIPGGNRTPSVTRTIAKPEATDTAFGEWIMRGSSDVNGDGKQDIPVGGISAAGGTYIIYGQ